MLHTASHLDISSVLRSCHFQSTTNFSNDHNIWYLFLRILFETPATLTLYTSKQGGLKSWWILIWELFWGRMWQEMPPSLMCFITFQAKMVQWKQVTWGEMLAWKWWIQSCLRWESSVGFPCHLVSLCFVAHHFIKLTLISNIESLGISASADFWLIVLTDKKMLWCYTYYCIECIYIFIYIHFYTCTVNIACTSEFLNHFWGQEFVYQNQTYGYELFVCLCLVLSLQALYSPLNIRC